MARFGSLPCTAVLLLAAVASAPARADEPLRSAIEDCRPRLDVQVDVGYARIATRCPQLIRVLESSEWEEWLPPGWRDEGNDLSIGGLEELATLIERERSREAAGRRPGTGKLRDVLIGLDAARTPRAGFWSRFRRWLETVFEQRSGDESSAWLERAPQRRSLPALVTESITYVALALVVALAALIVANELRVAGLLHRRARRSTRGGPEAPPAGAPLTWHDVERAARTERASLLLRLVLERLTHGGRLPAAASLTVREIEARALLPDADDRARLAALAAAAERARFAAAPAEGTALDGALAAGTELLGRLETKGARIS